MANLLVTIFMTLNLNPVMNIMFNVPAGCADTVRPRLISSVSLQFMLQRLSPAELFDVFMATTLQVPRYSE